MFRAFKSQSFFKTNRTLPNPQKAAFNGCMYLLYFNLQPNFYCFFQSHSRMHFVDSACSTAFKNFFLDDTLPLSSKRPGQFENVTNFLHLFITDCRDKIIVQIFTYRSRPKLNGQMLKLEIKNIFILLSKRNLVRFFSQDSPCCNFCFWALQANPARSFTIMDKR